MNSKSLICPLGDFETDRLRAIKEAENYCASLNIDKKSQNGIRLIAEELLGIVSSILETTDGTFWLEIVDGKIRVNVKAKSVLSFSTKAVLNSISSDEKNADYVGMSGLIRRVFDTMMFAFDSNSNISSLDLNSQSNLIGTFSVNEFDANSMEWSMEKAKDLILLEEKADEWDHLEYSVLKVLAENIIVGYRHDETCITVISKVTV